MLGMSGEIDLAAKQRMIQKQIDAQKPAAKR
jgi:hypothetical protein